MLTLTLNPYLTTVKLNKKLGDGQAKSPLAVTPANLIMWLKDKFMFLDRDSTTGITYPNYQGLPVLPPGVYRDFSSLRGELRGISHQEK